MCMPRRVVSIHMERHVLMNKEKTKLYKVTGPKAQSLFRKEQWKIPKRKDDDNWMTKKVGKLDTLRNGYHLFEKGQLLKNLNAEIWIAETHGDRITEDDCILVREARLVEQVESWNSKVATGLTFRFLAHYEELIKKTFDKSDYVVKLLKEFESLAETNDQEHALDLRNNSQEFVTCTFEELKTPKSAIKFAVTFLRHGLILGNCHTSVMARTVGHYLALANCRDLFNVQEVYDADRKWQWRTLLKCLEG